MDDCGRALTKRRRQILDAIVAHHDIHGYAPSVRELGRIVGLRSPAAVKSHLDTLHADGYIHVAPKQPRCIAVRHRPDTPPRPAAAHVPLIGVANVDCDPAAGIEEWLPVPQRIAGEAPRFVIRMPDSSMAGDGLLEGDYVVCRGGSAAAGALAAVAPSDGPVTVRRLPARHTAAAAVRGVVVGVLRAV